MKYIIANWKSNKTLQESRFWIESFITAVDNSFVVRTALDQDRVRIIIAPPYPFIATIQKMLQGRRNIVLAAQNISHFPAGSYTGEVAGRSLTGLVEYAIVGHSERRIHLHETNMQVTDKITYAKENGIEPILCIREKSEYLAQDVQFVAFEKFDAIGTGKNVELSAVLAVRKDLNLKKGTNFLYGASVDRHNAALYLRCPQIDGVLVGTASQDPRDFFSIIMEL